MKITDIISEAVIGTNPKRPSREGSRPERGHEPQKRYVTDRKTGKQYDPDEEFDKLKNSDEFKAQMKRMAQKEGFDYTVKDLGNDYAGFASNHSLKHKFLAKIKPEKRQLYKDKMNNMQEFDQLFQLFKVAKQRGDIIEQGVARPGQLVTIIKAPRMLDLLPGETFEVSSSDADGVTLKHGLGTKFDNVKFPHGTYKISKAQGVAEAKAPRSLCVSSKPDEDLGASQLASCKSQGLRARDGEKSHKLGKTKKSRVKVGGKRIKGDKYGGPLPDWS